MSIFDHGFLYGDGIYETVHAYQDKIFHWLPHARRLRQSAFRVGLRIPWTNAYLAKAVRCVLRANRRPNGSVRITLTRGPGPLGLNPALCLRPTLVMQLHPDRSLSVPWQKGVWIGIPHIRRNPREALDPQIKATSSLNTVLAKQEAEKLGVFEAVLLNLRGALSEGTTSNIFFVKRKRLYTPALDCGLLDGVTRGVVIQLARRLGMPVSEGAYPLAQLLKAEECFLSSTTLEVMPVIGVKWQARGLQVKRFGTGHPGPCTQRLQTAFRAYVKKELKLL